MKGLLLTISRIISTMLSRNPIQITFIVASHLYQTFLGG